MSSRVALVKVPALALDSTIREAVREAFAIIGGVEELCGEGKRVLIKPNIALPNSFDCANPQVTLATAEIFSGNGCEVILGEAGAKVVGLRKGPKSKVEVPGGAFFSELEIAKIALYGNCLKKHEGKGHFAYGCPPNEAIPGVTGSLREALDEMLPRKGGKRCAPF